MKQGKLIGVGILSALAASLCCIAPLLALVAGTTGAASNFAWIEPAKPYLIVVTILVLSMAWYQKLKPAKTEADACGCEPKKSSFFQSKLFLGIITAFAALMLTLPYYTHLFYSVEKKEVLTINVGNLDKKEFTISGMTCESCEHHVERAVNELNGIVLVDASYSMQNAIVEYDSTLTNIFKIANAINSTGYKVESYNTTK